MSRADSHVTDLPVTDPSLDDPPRRPSWYRLAALILLAASGIAVLAGYCLHELPVTVAEPRIVVLEVGEMHPDLTDDAHVAEVAAALDAMLRAEPRVRVLTGQLVTSGARLTVTPHPGKVEVAVHDVAWRHEIWRSTFDSTLPPSRVAERFEREGLPRVISRRHSLPAP
ncbi:MAG: hypothetical protein AAGD38_00015 [Acidobacteriota bacterium]